MGGNVVHISELAGWCHVDRPLVEVTPAGETVWVPHEEVRRRLGFDR